MSVMIRALAIASVTFAFSAVGCAAQTGDAPEEPTAKGEGSTGQVKQELFACPNDVPTSGFIEFPYNQVNYGASSGWKSGCVGFRVDRNLPFPSNVPAEVQAIADFPQYEGNWTATKQAQCEAAEVHAWYAEKPGTTGNYGAYEDDPPRKAKARPHLVFDPSSPSLLRIASCQAQVYIGGGCSLNPKYNYQRLDVRAVVNGATSNTAKTYAMIMNDTWC